MAKQSGLGQSFYIGGVDLSGDVGSIGTARGGPALLDVTGIDKSAFERIGGRRDGEISWSSWFNPAASQAHPTLSALPSTDVHILYVHASTIGQPAAGLVAKQVNYDGVVGTDGSFTFGVQALANSFGLEWCEMLTAGKRTDTAATNGASWDMTDATTLFGASAYLHVFALTGTNVIVTIEDSANDSAFTAVTGLAFTSVTSAPGKERLQTGATATIRRYVRAVSSGTFTSATFAVAIIRHRTATL